MLIRPSRQALSRRLALGLLGALALSPAMAQTDNWPAKPIRMVVPFPAGGGTDIIAREVTQKMAATNKWTFVIDNKPGSGGNIGIDNAAKSSPDGYSLVIGQTSNLAINPSLYSKLPYDPVKDLTPIGLVGNAALVVVVATNSPFRNLGDVINAAKAQPGFVNYATSGNGTVAHLATELLQREANVKLTHIPYKGAAQGINDVMGGQVPLFFANVASSLGHIQAGKLRPLAVTSALRARSLPEVPTMGEAGVAGYEVLEWNPILAPAGLPADAKALLVAGIRRALDDPEVLGRIRQLGGDVFADASQQSAGKFIAAQQALWAKVIKERNITTG